MELVTPWSASRRCSYEESPWVRTVPRRADLISTMETVQYSGSRAGRRRVASGPAGRGAKEGDPDVPCDRRVSTTLLPAAAESAGEGVRRPLEPDDVGRPRSGRASLKPSRRSGPPVELRVHYEEDAPVTLRTTSASLRIGTGTRGRSIRDSLTSRATSRAFARCGGTGGSTLDSRREQSSPDRGVPV